MHNETSCARVGLGSAALVIAVALCGRRDRNLKVITCYIIPPPPTLSKEEEEDKEEEEERQSSSN